MWFKNDFFDKKHHSTLLAQALKGLGNPFEWNELFHLNFPRTPASTKSFVILHFRYPPGYYVSALVLPRWSLTNATSSREGILVVGDYWWVGRPILFQISQEHWIWNWCICYFDIYRETFIVKKLRNIWERCQLVFSMNKQAFWIGKPFSFQLSREPASALSFPL